MDTTTFDTLAPSLPSSQTRRTALQGLVAGAAAAVAGGLLLTDDADARRKRGRKRDRKKGHKFVDRRRSKLRHPGERCKRNSQCLGHNICAVPVNGSNGDLYCSGVEGATCGAPNGDGDDTHPFCAAGYDCVPSGDRYVCQAVPDEV